MPSLCLPLLTEAHPPNWCNFKTLIGSSVYLAVSWSSQIHLVLIAALGNELYIFSPIFLFFILQDPTSTAKSHVFHGFAQLQFGLMQFCSSFAQFNLLGWKGSDVTGCCANAALPRIIGNI